MTVELYSWEKENIKQKTPLKKEQNKLQNVGTKTLCDAINVSLYLRVFIVKISSFLLYNF